MDNFQIDKSESKGFNMNQFQNNRPDMKVSVTKNNIENLPRDIYPESPRLVDVPSVGIELLENRSRKRDYSMDSVSQSIGNSEQDMYNMPMEDFRNIQEKLEGGRDNLYEFIQKKDSQIGRAHV